MHLHRPSQGQESWTNIQGRRVAHRDVQAQVQGDTHQHTQNCPATHAQIPTKETNVHRGQPQHLMESCSCPHSHAPTEVQRVQPPPATLEVPWRTVKKDGKSWQYFHHHGHVHPRSPQHLSAHGRSLILRRGFWLLCCNLSFLQAQFSPLWPVLRGLEAWSGGGVGVQMQRGEGGGAGRG